MKILSFLLFLSCLAVRAASPSLGSFEPTQFDTNNKTIKYRSDWTNDVGVISPVTVNSEVVVTNQSNYGRWGTPAKVTLLSLGTNYIDTTLHAAWLLNSPTNDATQVILSLSAAAKQGDHLFLVSQNGAGGFTLPNNSEQYDVPGAKVVIGSDWIGTTNRGLHLFYSAPDWVLEGVPTDPSVPGGGGGGSVGPGNINTIAMFGPSSSSITNSSLLNPTPESIVLSSSSASTPSLLIAPDNTAVASGFLGVKLADSDGQQDAVWLNGVKNTGWGISNPSARNADFSVNVLHNNAMAERLAISGLGTVTFFQADGNLETFEIAGDAVFPNDPNQFFDGTGHWAAPVATATNVLWALTGGDTLVPSPAIGLVSIVSNLSDNATNVVLHTDTATPFTQGLLVSHANSGTNVFQGSATGGMTAGKTWNMFWGGPLEGPGFATFADSREGDIDTIFISAEAQSSSTNYAYSEFTGDSLGLHFRNEVIQSANGYATRINLFVQPQIAEQFFDVALSDDTGTIRVTDFNPTVASTGFAVAYLLDTSNVMTNGDRLLTVRNAGNDRFTVDASGDGFFAGNVDVNGYVNATNYVQSSPTSGGAFAFLHSGNSTLGGNTNRVGLSVNTGITFGNWIASYSDSGPAYGFAADSIYSFPGTSVVVDGDLITASTAHPHNLGTSTAPWSSLVLKGITKAQKTALTPVNGMVVYQTDNTPGFRGYVNGTWFIFSMAADP